MERAEHEKAETDSSRKKDEKEKQKRLKQAKQKRDKEVKKAQTPQDHVEEIEEVVEEEDVDYAFTFIKRGEGLDKDEFTELMYSLKWIPKNSFLIRALYRGIGIHHAGLPTKYRQAVERLFRSRHIKVVVATGETLLSS